VVVPLSALEPALSAAEDRKTLIRDESIYGRLPLLPEEREYDTLSAHATCFAYAVATWCFLTGGYVAQYLGAVDGVICLLTGSVIGTFLTTLAPALGSPRFGIEAIDYTKSAFGQRGSKILLVFYLINQLGWTGLILVMFGNGIRNILEGFGFAPGAWVSGAGVALGLWFVYLLTTRGIHLLNISNRYIAPGLLVLTVCMFGLLLRDHGWSEILAAEPLDPFEDRWLNYMIVMELSIAGGISWWGGVGFLARNTRTRRNAVYPEIIQLGLGMGLVCCVALFSGLVVRASDPTEWMIPIGGLPLGILALVFVALANISSSAISVFASGLALRHVRVLRSRPWWHLVLWSLVPCTPFIFMPTQLYDLGSNFLAYNGTLYAPVVGILMADFVFVRRQRINSWAIFDDDPSAEYYYSKGFHWPALCCLLLGQVIYFSLLDPLSYEYSSGFLYLTASLPACVGPGIVYLIWMKLWPIDRRAVAFGSAEAAPADAPRVIQPNI
jgi:NCS1 family nucleobase:cation symporter-1